MKFNPKFVRLEKDGPYDMVYYKDKLMYRWLGEVGAAKLHEWRNEFVDEVDGHNSITVRGAYGILGKGLNGFFTGDHNFGVINGAPSSIVVDREDASDNHPGWTENNEYGIDLSPSSPPYRRLLGLSWSFLILGSTGNLENTAGRHTVNMETAQFNRIPLNTVRAIGGIFMSEVRPFPSTANSDIYGVGKLTRVIAVRRHTRVQFKYRVQLFNECHDPGAITEPEQEFPRGMCSGV